MSSKKVFAVIVCVLFIFSGCMMEREYKEDLIVELDGSTEKLIIKEWSFLLGSGAEVYYQREDQKPVFLGKTSGADDGFCPFAAGKYEITRNGNAVTLKWYFNTTPDYETIWHSETFELPDC